MLPSMTCNAPVPVALHSGRTQPLAVGFWVRHVEGGPASFWLSTSQASWWAPLHGLCASGLLLHLGVCA
eukprot:419108-Amphidinium_carterae.1